MNLEINEIFYSLQGEGERQGEASIFIRLAGCNLKCDFCDTNFIKGQKLSLTEILSTIKKYPCRWIIWTGGEPTLQLSDEVLFFFKEEGYLQAIESNGTRKLSHLLDYRVISPKGESISYAKKNNPKVEEVRLPIKSGDILPEIDSLPEADNYFLSPIFSEDEQRTQANIEYCVNQVLKNTRWRLSLQMHKLIGIE